LSYPSAKPKNRLINQQGSSQVFLFAVLGNFMVQMLFALIFEMSAPETLQSRTTLGIMGGFVIQAAYMFIYFKFVKSKNLFLRYPLKHKIKPSTALMAAALTVCMMAALFLPTVFSDLLLARIGFAEVPQDFQSPQNIILGALLIIVIAPFVEELIFRGAILSGLSRGTGVVKAVFLTALAFMLSHFNPAQSFYQFFVGLVAGFAVVFTGSLAIGIIIHTVNNLIAFIMAATPLNGLINQGLVYLVENPWAAAGVTIAALVVFGGIAVGILFVFWHQNRTCLQKTPAEEVDADTVVYLPTPPREINPFEDTPIDNTPPPKIVDKHKTETFRRYNKRMSRLFFWGGCAFSFLMWITVFLTSVLNLG